MDALLGALQWIADFLGAAPDGITGLLTQFWGWALQKLSVMYIELQISAMQFGWSVAKGILTDLQVAQRITDAISILPESVKSTLNFFKFPECLTNILTAYTTRFVMRFLPG